MELKLKTDEQEKKVEKKPVELSDEYIAGDDMAYGNTGASGGAYVNNPVVIPTGPVVVESTSSKKGNDVGGIIKWVVIIVLVLVGVKLISGLINPKTTDVTAYVDVDVEQVEKALDLSLEPSSNMVSKITHYSDCQVTVDGTEGIGVVYLDGVRKGLHVDGKNYSMYGLSIGDGEFRVDDAITYKYDEYFSVLNDMMGGKSTAYFYYNESKNDCLVIIINDKSARIVAMTYFNDYKLISENLDSLE